MILHCSENKLDLLEVDEACGFIFLNIQMYQGRGDSEVKLDKDQAGKLMEELGAFIDG